MTKTVTSLFHDQHTANAAVNRLEQAGISRSGVNVFTGSSNDLTDELSDYGVPEADAHAYAEGVRRGRALVVVACDDDEVDRVIGILDDDGILDLDEQQSSWRSDGWQGHQGTTGGAGLGAATTGLGSALTGSGSSHRGSREGDLTGSGSSYPESREGDLTGSPDMSRSRSEMNRGELSTRGDRDEVIPIAEEELHVGKQEVSHGRVRIHSHVVERPVQEQVSLRDETVEVERRPVSGDHRTTSLTGDPFQERTVEVEERDEEAVVSKEARVKEELVVHKDVEQRTETISDTVRRTEVDVEDDRNTRGTGTGGSTDRNR